MPRLESYFTRDWDHTVRLLKKLIEKMSLKFLLQLIKLLAWLAPRQRLSRLKTFQLAIVHRVRISIAIESVSIISLFLWWLIKVSRVKVLNEIDTIKTWRWGGETDGRKWKALGTWYQTQESVEEFSCVTDVESKWYF